MIRTIIFSVILFTSSCFSRIAYSQNIKGEIELNGFILGQYRKAVFAQLGRPLKRINTEDGWIYEFHAIKPDTSVYALFKYSALDTARVFSIQLNGHSFPTMHPFLNLTLGADREKVNDALGKFNGTDTIQDPFVIIQYYENRNYSVEIDERNKLYGIQIYGSIQDVKPKETIPSIDGFIKAILSGNVDSLLTHLAPDVELYINNKVVTYTGAAREEFNRKDSELIHYLLTDKKSVRYVFNQEKTEATPELRWFTERKLTTTVFKFYKSKVLSEIVYMPHAGKWKVYEIRFRN